MCPRLWASPISTRASQGAKVPVTPSTGPWSELAERRLHSSAECPPNNEASEAYKAPSGWRLAQADQDPYLVRPASGIRSYRLKCPPGLPSLSLRRVPRLAYYTAILNPQFDDGSSQGSPTSVCAGLVRCSQTAQMLTFTRQLLPCQQSHLCGLGKISQSLQSHAINLRRHSSLTIPSL